MIRNIIDNRKRRYRWAKITAICEPTWHDNSCADTDRSDRWPGEGVGYEELPETSLSQAVSWAAALKYPVTLYLYDLDDGIGPADRPPGRPPLGVIEVKPKRTVEVRRRAKVRAP